MKSFLLVLIFGLLFSPLFGQDALYFGNGNRIEANLVGATPEKILIASGDGSRTSALRRENVLLAFNKKGNYLLITTLSSDAEQAKRQIADFQNAAPRRANTDLILRTNPARVLAALIVYESDDLINYQQPSTGASASIGKNQVAAVFYRDGRHQLMKPPTDVVTALNSTRASLQQAASTVSVIAKTMKPARPSTPPGQAKTGNTMAPANASVTSEQYKQYRAKSLRRVKEFSGYLDIIADKNTPAREKDLAIEQATKLFLPEATIEVTSANRPGSRRLPVVEYLKRLKLIPYQSVDIEWTEIHYVKELTKAADGNYYGMITGQQTFVGYGANGEPTYSDVTRKNVKVKLQSFTKDVGGEEQIGWEVLLGNINLGVK
jgi:hypothetical protein